MNKVMEDLGYATVSEKGEKSEAPKKTSSKPFLPKEWVDRLFQRFEEKYGADCLPKIEQLELIKEQWQRGLGACTADEIKKGLSKLRFGHKPNLVEFFHYCKDIPYYRPNRKIR